MDTNEQDAACGYELGDWECREGGYLWYAGDGEGWDPEDCTHICPHCRTADYLEAAKDDAESCSSYSNNGSSGTGLDIWLAAERRALEANKPEAVKALAALGPVSALDGDDSPQGYSVVICNAQEDSAINKKADQMKPDAASHNPSPHYLRGLLEQASISQRQAATLLGVSDRMMRYYLADEGSKQHRKAPYLVQFAIECLSKENNDE